MATQMEFGREGRAASRWEVISSPAVAYWVLCGLIAALFLMGGGSRPDITSLVVLRPLTCIALGYGLLVVRWRALAMSGVPFWTLTAMLSLAALQLIPLPPGIWTTLPGRTLVEQISVSAGMADAWRPLSLVPSRTWNSLFALIAPLACLILLQTQAGTSRSRLVWPLLIAGAVSAILGLIQVLGPDEGPLYLYKVTNAGLAVGLFANRNHQAIFLASLIPLIAFVALSASNKSTGARSFTAAAAFGAILFVIPLILVTGSRAGAALSLATVGIVACLMWLHQRLSSRTSASGKRNFGRLAPQILLVGVLAVAAVSYALSRSLAFDRMTGSVDGGLRGDVLPTLVDMVQNYFPAGSGLGSFYLAYQIAEPAELLQPRYLNQAHNDLLQLLIEGGLPAAVIMLVAAWWLIRQGITAARQFLSAARRQAVDVAAFAWLSLAVLLAGSILDYPLRTPALMGHAAVLAFVIARATRTAQAAANVRSGVYGRSLSDKRAE